MIPKEELIRQLEEYKRFRETADAMKQFEKAAGNLFTKLPEESDADEEETDRKSFSDEEA